MPAIVETSERESAIVALLRRHDRDRYLLTLFVPAARRQAVQTLYAFNYEIARIRETVSEPMLGQIRLEWWREGIDAAFAGGMVRRHQVLTPLADTIRRSVLNREHFERLIAARERDLASESPATVTALEAYAEETAAPLQLLVLEALGVTDAEADRATRDAAIAFALSGLLRAAPFQARSPRYAVAPPLVHDAKAVAVRAMAHLKTARAVRGGVTRRAVPALLPAVLAAADLARLRRAAFDPFAPALTRPDPWRAWRLAIASATGRY